MKLLDYLITLFSPPTAIIVPINPNDSIELRTGVVFAIVDESVCAEKGQSHE